MTEISSQLINEAKDGDPRAVERLLKAAEVILRRITHQVDRADADDLIQNSLLRIAQALPQLIDPNAFRAWCSTIARNEIKMFYRSSKRREQAQLSLSFEPKTESEHIALPDVRSAILKLPSSQQLILTELYVSDRSYKDISRSLELPVSALKSRLHRARSKLKQEMNMQSKAKSISLSKDEIQSLHQAAKFSYLGDDRKHLSGIYLDSQGYAIGTDGHHLVIRTVPALKQLDNNFLIEPNSLDAINDAAELSVHLDEVQLKDKTDQVALHISDETFPDYRAILPTAYPVSCTVERVAFQRVLATTLANLKHAPRTTDTILLTINLGAKKIELQSNQDTSPQSNFSMSYEIKVGEPNNKLAMVKVAVNVKLLKDCVDAIDGENVSIKATAWNQPIEISGLLHRSLLMPIMI